MPQTTEEQKQQKRTTEQGGYSQSTTEPFTIRHNDDDDVLLISIDAKDPIRQKVMAAIQSALEQAQPPRNDEASRARAYAAEKLPDDWRRRKSEKPEEREIRHPGDKQKTGLTDAQQRELNEDRDQRRQREEEARQKR